METIGLAVLAILVVWKLGILKAAKDTIETSTTMATDEIKIQAAEHKTGVIERAAKLKAVDADTVAKAKANIEAINSFEL